VKRKKVILIGIDSLLPEFIDKFLDEGNLPNIKQLIKNGVYSRALPVLPTLTSTNWVTIATGVDPAVHGITCFFGHEPGSPLSELTNAFSSDYCKAEPIWVTAEKEGRVSIIIDYPASYPVTLKQGVHVGEYGCPSRSEKQISFSMCYSTEKYKWGSQIQIRPAVNWKNIPKSYSTPLESKISIYPSRWDNIGWPWDSPSVIERCDAKNYEILILDTQNKGYDRIIVAENKDAGKRVASLSVGDWSNWIITNFILKGRVIEAAFRMKLIELSSDGKKIKLYTTQIYPTREFAHPKIVSDELLRECGPFLLLAHNEVPYQNKWVDLQTFKEETEYQAKWFAKASEYLIVNKPWDLFFLKWHSPDHIQHTFWDKIDPVSPTYNPDCAEEYWDIFRWNYKLVDYIVGQIMKSTDVNTVVLLVSDHGHITSGKSVMINDLLSKAGLLTFDKNGQVNWAETKAYAQRMMYIYVNLKGREPGGIVEPGEEYEKIREEIITVLLDLKDPKTGKHPISFALKREEALALGLGGDRVGDVIYGMRGGYSNLDNRERKGTVFPSSVEAVWGNSNHGPYLGSTKFSIGSLNAVFVMAGPGIRKDYKREFPISLKDIAPTIAYLNRISSTPQYQGSVIKDALE